MTVGRRAPATGGEEGSVLLLTIFYAGLALVLILGVVAGTSLYLEHKRLLTLADAAALAGAEAFPLDAVLVDTGQPRFYLVPADVEEAVHRYIATAPHPNFVGLAVARATSVDGVSATVTLSASWRSPVLALVFPEGLPLEVNAVARSVLG
ncbi:MAG: hypothetical protein JWQ68_1093 [Cryobacterium sp.]|jgi:hypothetical protein|nr:hypothetical protein [Cryobacterium sp.]